MRINLCIFYRVAGNKIAFMLKILFPQIFFCMTFTAVFCQNIDSLKNALPYLRDSAKVDCINELSLQYILNEKKDSATQFAMLAYEESKKLNYIHGIAISLVRKARIAKHFDDELVLSEKLARESLSWFAKTPNQEGIYEVYHFLMYTTFGQSRFDEAIEFAKKKYDLSKATGNETGMFNALSNIGAIYKDAGNYERSLFYGQQCRQLALKTGNKQWLQGTLVGLGELYMKIDDYNAALSNFRQAFQMDDPQLEKQRKNGDFDIWMKMEYAEIFSHLDQFDSAWHYFELYKPPSEDDRYYRVYLVSTGEYYFLKKEYSKALQNFLRGLQLHKKLSDRNEVQRTLIFIAKTYLALNNNSAAIQYAKEGLQMANETKAKQIFRDCYQVFYTVYDRWHQTDSANLYFRRYSKIRDSVANEQLKAQLAVAGFEQKIELLNKEAEIKQARLEQTALLENVLVGGVIALLLLGGFIFRNIILKRRSEKQRHEHEIQLQKIESKKIETELKQQATDLEMQALRAQMNPHFIFNCLSSINHFILKNQSEVASDYLTKFSRLIRHVLNNSRKPMITLEDELEMLRLYLDLERLRFKNKFDFNIIFKNEINESAIFIPPLLLQPFAENAIWHGMMNKEGRGQLDIELSRQKNILSCIISDNGVGRSKANELKSKSAEKEKSMGVQITAERLALFNGEGNGFPFFEIEDINDEHGNTNGTRVILKIGIQGDE